jgi:hypothetical protein
LGRGRGGVGGGLRGGGSLCNKGTQWESEAGSSGGKRRRGGYKDEHAAGIEGRSKTRGKEERVRQPGRKRRPKGGRGQMHTGECPVTSTCRPWSMAHVRRRGRSRGRVHIPQTCRISPLVTPAALAARGAGNSIPHFLSPTHSPTVSTVQSHPRERPRERLLLELTCSPYPVPPVRARDGQARHRRVHDNLRMTLQCSN